MKLLMAMTLAMAWLQVQAFPIAPGDCGDGSGVTIECWFGTETTNNEINKVIGMMFPVTELYQANVGGAEDKLLAGSYDTAFMGKDAEITYGSGEFVNCPTCYLLVKDADSTPAWYLFNISDLWNGKEAITLKGFWPNSANGAISQVSIYGGPPGTSVPAPGPLGLLSIGLLLSSLRRLKKR